MMQTACIRQLLQMTFLMTNVVLLFVYVPHDGLAVTSFSQPSCHSNEVHGVGQMDQPVGAQDADCCCPHVLSPTSAAIGDRIAPDPAVDPPWTR